MNLLCFVFATIFLVYFITRTSSQDVASLPPRGWNSYDSFSWTISEAEFLQNAEIIATSLKPHGYEYVVVDYLWYRKLVKGASADSLGYDVIDEWGRMQPDPDRWPSSRGGKGFTEVANKVHAMGLKFGIHIMNGISTQAVNANTPILDVHTGLAYNESGKQFRASDIGITSKACAWMKNGFMSVNTDMGAARAFLESLHMQYSEWGVDLVKHDCAFGADFDLGEITIVSNILKGLNHPVVYSLSPGTNASPDLAKSINGLANMYRVTGDDWDTWGDVLPHFDVARDFATAKIIGADGLNGKSWPDLDMLPLGWLTDPAADVGPHRFSRLTLDEQKTQMTLWSIAKSPLMFGGDMRKLDNFTLGLITNPTALEINGYSSNNQEFPYITTPTMTADKKVRAHKGKITNKRTFGLVSCNDPSANRWSIESHDQNLQQICWNKNQGSNINKPFCFYKKAAPLATDNGLKDQNQEKVQLLANKETDICFEGTPRKKLSSKEFKGGAFSPCGQDANQMWEIQGNGTLKNSYSNLCGVFNSENGGGFVDVRAWIATGRNGEIYVAFFNLEAKKTTMSTKLEYLDVVFPSRKLPSTTCHYHEVWSGKYFGSTTSVISIDVEAHGTALFQLNCP